MLKLRNKVVPLFIILLLSLSLGGCTGRNSNITEPIAHNVEKQDLQAIYLSREDGYFAAAEFEQQEHAELTSDFSEFISLAEQ